MLTPPQINLDIVYHLDVRDEPNIHDDSERYRAAADWIAGQFSIASLSCSISIVDDPTIQELNREHLAHDWPTDVISFVFECLRYPAGLHIDGEVIASYETARRLSSQAGWSTSDELLLYCIHGILHLAGLDDLDERQRRDMREAEQACLLALSVPGADQHLLRWENVSY